MAEFSGFSEHCFKFFRGLEKHNSKVWFEAHRADYQEHVLAPMRQLAGVLGEPLSIVDSRLLVDPAKIISRIYRDVRFSKNKAPYRTNLWFTFKRPREDWADTPAWYFEVSETGYAYGMGFFAASIPTMNTLRTLIEEKPEKLRQVIGFLRKRPDIKLAGEMYRRPRPGEVAEELRAWHDRKTLYLVRSGGIDRRLMSAGILDDLMRDFAVMTPLYHLFWEVKVQSSLRLGNSPGLSALSPEP